MPARRAPSTTPDPTAGVAAALRRVLETSGTPAGDVAAVMVGTTHFTNAVVERRRLQPTAVLRLGLPATAALPPMVDWPADLRAAIVGGGPANVFLCHGGREFDGRPISPFDPAEIARIAEQIAARGITAVAVAAVFSPVDPEDEERAAEIVERTVPGAQVTRSHRIGRVGLLERESAAILNACLGDLARETVAAFRRAVAPLGLGAAAPLYLTQNDGTLMDAGFAERFPVLTFASGPTNSIRGAAFLSGLQDALVVDVGGTTTDVGALAHGFPREAAVAVDVGGVRTNFRMPDVLSVGLGGGSLISENPLAVGPRSVGYRLTEQALVFGGSSLTATDVAVAAGQAEVGDPALVRHLPPALVRGALARIRAIADGAIDRARTSAAPLPVVLVGGGSILLDRPPAGASHLVKPDHHEAANAVGAAIAQISGEVDRVSALGPGAGARARALDDAKTGATANAVAAGADPATVQIVDVDDVPLAYLPGNATRVRVKAVGDLAPTRGGRGGMRGGKGGAGETARRPSPAADTQPEAPVVPSPPLSPPPPPSAKRVLLATYGSLGDLHPFLAVALALQARGHDAVVATHPAYRERVERLGLGFRPVRPDLPDSQADPQVMARVMDPRLGADEIFRRGVLPRLRDAYDDTLAASQDADLLVSHTLTMTVRLVAETTGTPWASAVLQPLAFFSAHDFPVVAPAPFLAGLRGLGPRANRALLTGMRFSLDRWVGPWHRLRADLGLPRTRDNPILDGQHAPALVLALFSRHFAPPQPDWPSQTVQTGFPFLDQGATTLPPELARFLDAGPPPLVFTLGSAAVLAAGAFYAASAAAAAALGRRAVLVVGDDPRNLAGLTHLPPDVLAVPYAPYAALFPRAAAVVHQGGIGTTAETLRAGRPMLVMPYGHDQPDNADRVARLGAGRTLPRRAYTASRAAAALRPLLADPAYAARAAALGERIRAEDGAAAAADALERLLPVR